MLTCDLMLNNLSNDIDKFCDKMMKQILDDPMLETENTSHVSASEHVHVCKQSLDYHQMAVMNQIGWVDKLSVMSLLEQLQHTNTAWNWTPDQSDAQWNLLV